MSRLFVVGIGPGSAAGLTEQARAALEQSALICGYTAYVDLLRPIWPYKRYLETGMGGELERCRLALEAARRQTVALVCSGDAGVYGLAGLVYGLSGEYPDVEIEMVAGVTAALSGAALLGAPLTQDFAIISLSDILTPWELIEQRLYGAAAGGFVTVLYNPGSSQRADHLRRACDILLKSRGDDTVCGLVKNAGRAEQYSRLLPLAELRDTKVDMFTIVFIGNNATRNINGKMVTARLPLSASQTSPSLARGTSDTHPSHSNNIDNYGLSPSQVRGTNDGCPSYSNKLDNYGLPPSQARGVARSAGGSTGRNILLFGGASEEHALLEALLTLPVTVTLSVASPYGVALLPTPHERLKIKHGPMEARQMADYMDGGDFCCVIDATHPYAVIAGANIRAAAAQTGLPYLRLLREASDLGDCLAVDSAAGAVAELNRLQGAVLLTTGSKDLQVFSGVSDYHNRLYARVLPTSESMAACVALGLPLSHIIAMQGPFSTCMNAAILREFNIKTLVTKDGGVAGGFPQKLAAARDLGVQMIVIRRPKETGLSCAELMLKVEEIVTMLS